MYMTKKNFGNAYGKLYIAGEYAILTPKSKALLYGVNLDIKVFINIKENEIMSKFNNLVEYDTIYSDLYKIKSSYKINFKYNELFNFLKYIKAIFQINKPLNIEIFSNLHKNGKKYGLGSSAAVLVAITKAFNNFFELNLDDYKIFKTIVIFNLLLNKKGSFGDIAGCINQGFTYYQKFNLESIKNKLNDKKININYFDKTKNKEISTFFQTITYIEQYEKAKKFKQIIYEDWEDLIIENIKETIDIKMIAKWTKKYVDTNEHIDLFNEIKNNELKKDYFNLFVENSNKYVNNLKNSIKLNNTEMFLENIINVRNNLLFLEEKFNILMETEYMKKWINEMIYAKQSGSGQGDMMICFKKNNKFDFEIQLD